MQLATGIVVDGKVVVEGVSLPEGAVVIVIARGADESFSLTEAQENELLTAMAEVEGGEYVTLEELLQSLPKQDGGSFLTYLEEEVWPKAPPGQLGRRLSREEEDEILG